MNIMLNNDYNVKRHDYTVKQYEINVKQHDYNVMRHYYTVKPHKYNVKRHDCTVKQHYSNFTWHDYNFSCCSKCRQHIKYISPRTVSKCQMSGKICFMLLQISSNLFLLTFIRKNFFFICKSCQGDHNIVIMPLNIIII